MTTAKDANSRPSSQHRHSVGLAASSLPSHKSRTHSHSLSMGSLNTAHRASRRKSVSSSAHLNGSAMAAAMKGSLEGGRRPSKASLRGVSAGNHLAPGSLPHGGGAFGSSSYGGADAKTSAVTDGPPLASIEKSNKARIRRASEGSRLIKGEGRRITNGELKCDQCGKGYKHSSCLTKHLWEHTPHWQYTSKLLISKHQQVQLLEAAQVLVGMNADGTEAIKDSDTSSASPEAFSGREESVSSAETSPPPDGTDGTGYYSGEKSYRHSTASSAYSQSYQSGGSIFSDSVPSTGFSSHYRQFSNDGRPTTSGTSVGGSVYGEDEHADLTAAVNLLSCSYGTPKSGSTMLPPDVPPVPPLPARYLDQKLSASTATVTPGKSPLPGQRSYSDYRADNRDVRMGEDDDSEDDYDRRHVAHDRIDEDDEGMFGRMEE